MCACNRNVSARLEKSPGASVGARRSVDEPKVVPGVVVSSVVQGNSAQAPSESASVLGVSNIASGESDKV